MITYKLLRVRNGRLFPLFVETTRQLPFQTWLEAGVGELADENHVRSPKLGKLALRPGWHSCTVPFTDWIGKRGKDGTLQQRADTVWCECEVDGKEQIVKNGLKVIPDGWYYFKTKPGQIFPWIISNRIKLLRPLEHGEVEAICEENGVKAQQIASHYPLVSISLSLPVSTL